MATRPAVIMATEVARGGHVRAIYVVETPIDDLMAPALGSPRELLRELPSEVVERVSGAMPITVHRLAR